MCLFTWLSPHCWLRFHAWQCFASFLTSFATVRAWLATVTEFSIPLSPRFPLLLVSVSISSFLLFLFKNSPLSRLFSLSPSVCLFALLSVGRFAPSRPKRRGSVCLSHRPKRRWLRVLQCPCSLSACPKRHATALKGGSCSVSVVRPQRRTRAPKGTQLSALPRVPHLIVTCAPKGASSVLFTSFFIWWLLCK